MVADSLLLWFETVDWPMESFRPYDDGESLYTRKNQQHINVSYNLIINTSVEDFHFN